MSVLILKQTRDIGDGTGYKSRAVADDSLVLSADKTLQDVNDGKLIRKIGVSVCSGCGIGCIYCFTRKFKDWRQLSVAEIVNQVELVHANFALDSPGYDEVKISFKQMGDVSLNVDNTCQAIEQMYARWPFLHFVVSTSGSRNPKLFVRLRQLHEQGIQLRLQFSCHTTSDEERNFLSPQVPMMTLAEIAEVANHWPGNRVTLNFVVMESMNYDVSLLAKLFDVDRVFIKVNFLDDNQQLAKHGLVDASEEKVRVFISDLQNYGFRFAFRHGSLLQ
ncbi:radical SAM protein [Candidatus Parcubacteria bacterium]|jgi:adenine C2-methylase RlmN of 23S rRNA A2503 and tRNA A37|nr:radical SAM protein [Candidatus Parcubacteria bacterium]